MNYTINTNGKTYRITKLTTGQGFLGNFYPSCCAEFLYKGNWHEVKNCTICAELRKIYDEQTAFNFTIVNSRKNFTPADLMSDYAKQNGGTIETTRHFETLLHINGKRYRYDHLSHISDNPITVYLREVL